MQLLEFICYECCVVFAGRGTFLNQVTVFLITISR